MKDGRMPEDIEMFLNMPEILYILRMNEDGTDVEIEEHTIIHAAASAHTDCEPNANVEAMRVALDQAQIEARPVWKPMHKQPCYKDVPAYVNGVSEALFKVGMCLPAGPYVTDDDVKYIVDTIKENIIG